MPAILAIVSIIAVTLLGFSNPFSGGQNQVGDTWLPGNTGDKASCQPNIEINRTMRVNVDDELNSVYVNNEDHPEFNKEGEEWILIKTAAPIPAWKVLLIQQGERFGRPFGEMEKMGAAVTNPSSPDNNRNVYIGTGWCDPVEDESFSWGEDNLEENACLDPLVQDVLFVVDNQGATTTEGEWLLDREWPTDENADPPRTQDNINKYWWTFNVYYKASKLPANPTVNDLPCWIRELAAQCPGAGDIYGDNRREANEDNICEPTDADVLGATAAPSSTNQVLGATIVPTTNPLATLHKGPDGLIVTETVPPGVTIADDYLYGGETTRPTTNDTIIGTAYHDHFDVYLQIGDVEGEVTNHQLILDPHNPQDPKYYLYGPVLNTSQPNDAATLQLGSFNPGIPSFFYEWWTPSCKPAIYLYPEKETEISVKVKPDGFITTSIPEHGVKGWNVIAQPNGSLTTLDKKPLDLGYLYYEASLNKVHVPKDHGWIRTKEELPAFFSSTLSHLGLSEQERKDFLDYWIPKLQEGDKWFITLIDREELNRIEPIEFSKEPDNFIRVRFYFEKLDDKNMNKFSLHTKYEIPNIKYERRGFTAVDWGGIVGNGSCGIEETVQ